MSSLFSITFALGIAVGWEIYEFIMDSLYGMTLQKGNSDTMMDFISCSVGAVITMLFVAFLRNGVIGKDKEKIKEEKRLLKEERLLKEKLYKEYLESKEDVQ
jgi:hypothetical protein